MMENFLVAVTKMNERSEMSLNMQELESKLRRQVRMDVQEDVNEEESFKRKCCNSPAKARLGEKICIYVYMI
jgi:hypothetical protein